MILPRPIVYPKRLEEPKTTPRVEERPLVKIGGEYTTRFNYTNTSPNSLIVGSFKVDTGRVRIGERTADYTRFDSERKEIRTIEKEYGTVISVEEFRKKEFIIRPSQLYSISSID